MMANRIEMDERVTVGPQPSEEELKELAEEGFKSVVNFRTAGEEDQPLGPDEEAARVRSLGMAYLHVPVSMDSMEAEQADRFREKFRELPKPVYAHCKSGKRAGAFVMMHTASEEGLSGEKALEQAEQMGFACDVESLKKFVKRYIDEH